MLVKRALDEAAIPPRGRPTGSGAAATPAFGLVLAFAAGHLLSYLFRSTNAVLGPVLRDELGLSASALGLLTSAYFLAFALAQIPLGVLLDRFGARRVESALLVTSAVGAAVFAAGRSLPALAAGRALIGLGVSACLMAALKSFAERFGTDRLASLTGWMMAAGGVGAMIATAPLDVAIHALSWRSVFVALASVTAAVAAWIAVVVPDPARAAAPESLRAQLAGLATVIRSAHFWQVAPLAFAATGGFFAVQGLWSASWLIEVNGLPRAIAAEHLAGMNTAMMVTFVAIGFVGNALARRGIGPAQMLAVGFGIGLTTLLAIVTSATDHTRLLWIAYGAFSSCGPLVFAQAARGFPPSLAGRANTALNVLIFAGAFGAQWGMGAAIDRLRAAGHGPAAAHRATFAALFVLQVAAYAWFVVAERRAARRVEPSA